MIEGAGAGTPLRVTLEIDVSDVAPGRDAVLAAQGMAVGAPMRERVSALLDHALDELARLADVRGVFEAIDADGFGEVFPGEGLNAPETPLESIYPRATHLALFVATLGEPVCGRIGELFAEGDPALGYMLDAVASEAADRTAYRLADRYLATLRRAGSASAGDRVLPYSPGYCGWHVSGQQRLFARLRPEEIGVTVNPSSLMQPLKSVSGVFAVGVGRIHRFAHAFDFCAACTTKECRDRIEQVAR